MSAKELIRTLIVDDELLIRQGIKHYIDWEKEGFQIVGEASNGQEALELIEKVSPHILITDIIMPIMDGEELTRLVKEKYPQMEIIILSSFSEYDYVRSTFQNGVVDYILKPKLDAEGLLKTLKTAANRIPYLQKLAIQENSMLSIGQKLERMISGYEVCFEPGEVENMFPYRHFFLFCADVNKIPTTHLDICKKEIERIFLKEFPFGTFYTLCLNQSIILIVLNTRSENNDKVVEISYHLAQSMEKAKFALSDVFEEMNQIGEAYKTLLQLLPYHFYLNDMPLLMERNLPDPPNQVAPFNLEQFTNDLKLHNFDVAFMYLSSYASELSKCYTMDIFEYKSFMGNCIFNIIILLGNMDLDVKELDKRKYTYFKRIEEASSAQATLQILNGFIEAAKQCITAVQNQPMKKLLNYIKNHHHEPLSLTEVAKQFHFSPSYLSSYFSTHNKEGFNEYLNRIRIEEASKLLIQGAASISQISAMVGYSDHSYFCKVFKKVQGMSPSQFKRKYTTDKRWKR